MKSALTAGGQEGGGTGQRIRRSARETCDERYANVVVMAHGDG